MTDTIILKARWSRWSKWEARHQERIRLQRLLLGTATLAKLYHFETREGHLWGEGEFWLLETWRSESGNRAYHTRAAALKRLGRLTKGGRGLEEAARAVVETAARRCQFCGWRAGTHKVGCAIGALAGELGHED